MKQQFMVFWFELKRTVTKWSFWLRTLAIPGMMLLVLGLSMLSNKIAVDTTEQLKQSKFSVIVMDESGLITKQSLSDLNAQLENSKSAGIDKVKNAQVDAFIYYPSDPSVNKTEVYAKDDGIMDNGKYSSVADSLLQASIASKLGSQGEVKLLQSGTQVSTITYKNGVETKGFGSVIAPGMFLIIFYVVILLLGNQMLTSVTEEKENRVIEMILTCVSTTNFILGKIWALFAMGGVQIMAILLPLLVVYFGFRSDLHMPSLELSDISWNLGPIAAGFALCLTGFVTFTALLVAIGAAVPSAKEASGYFGGVMILILLPFYALPAIISSPDQLIVTVLSYFPLTSPITLMMRNAVGNVSAIQLLLGIFICLVTGLLLLAAAVNIFKHGSLEYSRKLKLGEIFSFK